MQQAQAVWDYSDTPCVVACPWGVPPLANCGDIICYCKASKQVTFCNECPSQTVCPVI